VKASGAPADAHANPRVERTRPYAQVFPSLLDGDGHRRAHAEITGWPGYAPTPLVPLPRLARALGIAQLAVKDEGGRFGLGSFKAIGGAYAVYRALAAAVARETGALPGAAALASGEYAGIVRGLTVTCASEGNHGRAVAWGAARFGCHAVICLRENVNAARVAAIAAHGAAIEHVAGSYDDAVRAAQAAAERHGRIVISDTAYAGCEAVPEDVMQGYTVIGAELLEQLGADRPTHVFVQAGVGGLAAALAAHLWRELGGERPHFVVVEPDRAACLLASVRARAPARLTGPLDSVMSCLACGEPSTIAFRILERAADAFMAIPDEAAHTAVHRLGNGAGDPPVSAGASGAAGVAALLSIVGSPAARARLGITPDARAVCLITEAAVPES
jgi:diaminopropionate ammonia-lyase